MKLTHIALFGALATHGVGAATITVSDTKTDEVTIHYTINYEGAINGKVSFGCSFYDKYGRGATYETKYNYASGDGTFVSTQAGGYLLTNKNRGSASGTMICKSSDINATHVQPATNVSNISNFNISWDGDVKGQCPSPTMCTSSPIPTVNHTSVIEYPETISLLGGGKALILKIREGDAIMNVTVTSDLGRNLKFEDERGLQMDNYKLSVGDSLYCINSMTMRNALNGNIVMDVSFL